ncbi:MAG: FAD-linked oxidase C-terminal domain-containing protein, partial [Archaeoglobaceae archaeon]
GTLGVITKAIIRLLPPLRDMTMLAIPFKSVENALNFAIETSLSFTPLAMEFMDKKAVEIGETVSGKRWVSKEGNAHIIAILENREEAEKVADIAYNHGAIDIFVPSQREQKDLLELRGKIYFGLKDKIIEILDVCIPPAEIAEFLRRSEELARKYGIELITYGHLGDGNLHQHPLLFDGWEKSYPKFRKEILKLGIEFGGVISGEHGIGVLKKEELREFYPEQYNLMLEIKKIFDPNFILNPDKIF